MPRLVRFFHSTVLWVRSVCAYSMRVLPWVAIFSWGATPHGLAANALKEHDTPSYAEKFESSIQFLNDQIRRGWKENGLSPSEPASDSKWCRRVFIDVIGRIPRVDELNQFLRSGSGEKKQELVHRLLYEDAYRGEYARNWSTIWLNLLIGRSGGSERNSLTSRAGMRT